MATNHTSTYPPTTYRRDRAQSLIVTVIVLFVLLFIGGIFVGLVARNLLNSGRAKDTISADEFARAGIQHADYFLQYSPEGADWRPQPATSIDPNDPDERWLRAGYSRIDLPKGRALIRVSTTLDPRNPLGRYIKIESVGRVGVIDRNDPTSFLSMPAPRLRRELVAYKSIGITDYLRYITNRYNDTKFVANIGVPPVGVPLSMQLGELPVRFPTTRFATPKAPWLTTSGAPIFANGDLKLTGNLNLAVDPRRNEAVMAAGKIIVDPANRPTISYYNYNPFGVPQYTPATQPIFGSDETFNAYAGAVRDASDLPDANGYVRGISRLKPPLIDQPDPATGSTRYRLSTRESGLIMQAPDPISGQTVNFNTGRSGFGGGVYIDNNFNAERESTGVNGGQSLRSVWLKPGSTPNWIGPNYVPPGVYIEPGYHVVEPRDNSGNLMSGQFMPRPGIKIIRDASDRPFTDPTGALTTRQRIYTFFIFKPRGRRPVIKLDNEAFRDFLKRSFNTSNERQIDAFMPEFNGVLFAEGNVRIRGLMPSISSIAGPGNQFVRMEDPTETLVLADANPPAITIVSGANIYIEGSLLREAPESMIGLLAQNNVVVNTTMFMAPNKGLAYAGTAQDEQAPYHANITAAENNSTPPFSLSFAFGENPVNYLDANGARVPLLLMMRHGAPPQSEGGSTTSDTYLNLIINEAIPPAGGSSLFNFGLNPPYPLWVYPLPAVPNPQSPAHHYQVGEDAPGNWLTARFSRPNDQFENWAFQLSPNNESVWAGSRTVDHGNYTLFTQPGIFNTIRPTVDPTYAGSAGVQDYLFARAAVVPMDVRIEALLYAQNGSFFVIPGYSMNTNPADTRDAALARAQAAGLPAGTMLRPAGTTDWFPFYGEPTDIRITIVGAIAENQTASESDQSAWMQRWGWIPEVFGSTAASPFMPSIAGTGHRIPLSHVRTDEVGGTAVDTRTTAEQNAFGPGNGIARGLRLLYDPSLLSPHDGYNPDTGRPFRTDVLYTPAGTVRRTLPPLPRLPVSPDFVFMGEVR
jgi:hypothetical protein